MHADNPKRDPKRGTLPDGRPFRTDLDGTQVIDYIADLENSVGYLKDRVATLEIDLEASKAKIERMKSFRSNKARSAEPLAIPEPKLFERDLMVATPNEATIVSANIKMKDGDTFNVKNNESKSKSPTKFVERKLIPPPPPSKPADLLANERSLLMKEIGTVNALISKRADLHKAYVKNQSANPVSIKLTEPRSKSGRKVSDVTNFVKEADSAKKINAAKVHLAQIKRVISDDILLINRLYKVN